MALVAPVKSGWSSCRLLASPPWIVACMLPQAPLKVVALVAAFLATSSMPTFWIAA